MIIGYSILLYIAKENQRFKIGDIRSFVSERVKIKRGVKII